MVHRIIMPQILFTEFQNNPPTLAMNSDMKKLCEHAVSMGVSEACFLRKLVSKKVSHNRHILCNDKQLQCKMRMWLHKEKTGHSKWTSFSKADALISAESAASQKQQLPAVAVHENVDNVFYTIEHGVNEEKIYNMTRVFLEEGGKVSSYGLIDAMGECIEITLLQAACFFKRVKTVRLLLRKGADPNQLDSRHSESAVFYLFRAVWHRTLLHTDHVGKTCEVLRALIESSADLSVRNTKGETFMHRVVLPDTQLSGMETQNQIEIFRVLSKHMYISLICDNVGENSLMRAARFNLIDTLLLLRIYGNVYEAADMQDVLFEMTNPLQDDNYSTRARIVRMLFDLGISENYE